MKAPYAFAANILVAAAILLVPAPLRAGGVHAASASVEILQPATAQQVSQLSFGKIVVGNGGGAITVASDGTRLCDTGVLCIGSFTPGMLRLSGVTGAQVQVSLPVRIDLTSASQGSDAIAVYLASEHSNLTIEAPFSLLRIGGMLSLSGKQSPGIYYGAYEIHIEYQ